MLFVVLLMHGCQTENPCPWSKWDVTSLRCAGGQPVWGGCFITDHFITQFADLGAPLTRHLTNYRVPSVGPPITFSWFEGTISTHLGVSGLSAAGPPSKLRPLLGLFCLASREAADAMETVLARREPVSGEMRDESM